VPKEDEAVDQALALARQGDLLVICCKEYERAWRQIASHHARCAR
jgi:hypothetical protein